MQLIYVRQIIIKIILICKVQNGTVFMNKFDWQIQLAFLLCNANLQYLI